MFGDCTSLTSAPELKATTLADGCYYYMFFNCTSLTSTPELKATTLADKCYESMFEACTKLSTVTMLAPGDKISEATDCYYGWLYQAGTDKTISSHTLKIQDKTAYDVLIKGYLPAEWQIGNCTVLDAVGNEITKQ